MKQHPLARVKPLGSVRFEFEHRDEKYELARPDCLGDVAFGVLYPNPVEARQACLHAAKVNGRQASYPLECYEYVLAISACLVVSSDVEAPDSSAIFAVYDADPVLWQKLVSFALRALGLVETDVVDGSDVVREIHALLVAGKTREASEVAAGFLASFGSSASDLELPGVDPVVEGVLGNSSRAVP